MDSAPTLSEYNAYLLKQCYSLLQHIDQHDLDIKDLLQSAYKSAETLIHALDIRSKDKAKLLNQLEAYSSKDMKLLILSIKEICIQVTQIELKKRQNLPNFCREEERMITHHEEWPDQTDEKACWFRRYFVGKPYITLIGPFLENDNDFAIFSIVKEVISKTRSQYRIIVRTKQDANMGFVVDEKDSNELIAQLEYLNQASLLEIETETKRHRPLRSFSSAIITGMTHVSIDTSPTRMMRASLLFLFQEINFKLFKEFSAETTIMLGLEKEFLKYDEIGIPKSYKFGVLTVREGQTTEEEWFSNSGISTELNLFLNIIGRPVQLKDYKGYAAGLDTQTGESGELSYVSMWKDHEIMYHIAPLMPTRESDHQQVHRKRHIGNDIVCIIFVEGKNRDKFNPNSIRSQFLHVFIVVYFNVIDNQSTWRIEVLHDKSVKPFAPPIPSPPIFYNEQDLRNFLILKLINAENASLKSEKFAVPNNKARLCILKNLIETGLDACTRNYHDGRGDKKYNYGGERPKSAGATTSRNSFKALENYRPSTPDLPPVPSISRSNVLRDIKSLTRRKSSGQQYHRQARCMNSTISLSNNQHLDELRQDHNIISEESNNCDDEDGVTIIAHTSGSGIRFKAQSLVSSMIGRRNSRNGRTVSS